MGNLIPYVLMSFIEVLAVLVRLRSEPSLGKDAEVMQVQVALVRSAESNAILGAFDLKAVAQKDGRVRYAKQMVQYLFPSGDQEDPSRYGPSR